MAGRTDAVLLSGFTDSAGLGDLALAGKTLKFYQSVTSRKFCAGIALHGMMAHNERGVDDGVSRQGIDRSQILD